MTHKFDFVSPAAAGKLLGLSIRTVQQWVDAGALPAWKTTGGHRRIPREAVDQLMEERSSVIGACFASKEANVYKTNIQIFIVTKRKRSVEALLDEALASSSPVSVEIFSDLAEMLLKIGCLTPDALIICADDFDLDTNVLVDTLQVRPIGLHDIHLAIYKHVNSKLRVSVNLPRRRQIHFSARSFRSAIQSIFKFMLSENALSVPSVK